MKAGKIIAWAFVASLGIAGIYIGVGVKRLMSFCYKIVKYNVKIDLDYVHLSVDLKIQNPSYLKIDIYDYDIDVYVNNVQVGNVASKRYIELKKEQVSTISIPAKIPYLKSIGNINGKQMFNAFVNKEYDKIYITLKGKFNGGVLGVSATVPIDYKITLKEIAEIMSEPDSGEPCNI